MKLRIAFSGIRWISTILANTIGNSLRKSPKYCQDNMGEAEREDILERARWACSKVIVTPQQLIASMPSVLNDMYAGQSALYSCAFLAHALANISVLYPDTRNENVESIAELISLVNTPTIRRFDTSKWGEDAMASLNGSRGSNSHLPYLSLLAWMICNYKLTGGDDRFDQIFHDCCESLHRSIVSSPYNLNPLSYPKMQIFVMDVLIAIIDLYYYSELFSDERYKSTVDKWIHNAKTIWVHKPTGLLHSMLQGDRAPVQQYEPRGCYTAFTCAFLGVLDKNFGKEQYDLLKKVFLHETTFLGLRLKGIKEYINEIPMFKFEQGDAALIIKGIGLCGTALALGSATYYEDWSLRGDILTEADRICKTKHDSSGTHYDLSDYFIPGEILALAMRTNIKRQINIL